MHTDERIRILIADNLPRFAGQCAQFLERAGYHVFQAHSLEEARRHLERTHLHVAILDLRLVSDRDPEDISGIELARNTDASIAKIILTAYPDYEPARSALTPQSSGQAPAAAFLGKDEGFEVLLQKVVAAVDRLEINCKLRIEWGSYDALAVARLILPHTDSEHLLDQTVAMEDLFRRLFRGCENIRIMQMLFEADQRAALEVRAWHPDKGQGSFIVVCGRRGVTDDEAKRFREYAPGPSVTVPFLRDSATTAHLGALAYEYPSVRFEVPRTFSEVYKSGTEASIQSALRKLFGETLSAWHTGHPVIQEEVSRDPNLSATAEVKTAFNERLAQIAGQLVKVGVRMELTPTGWKLGIRERNLASPRPEAVFKRILSRLTQPLTQCVPGELRPETVLVLADGSVLAIDFRHVGPAPWPQSYVAMECAVRFDLWSCADPGELLEVEEALNSRDWVPSAAWYGAGSHRKLAKVVATIRQCAGEKIRSDPFYYHIEVIRQIAHRIDSLAERHACTDEDVDRLAHLVIAAATLARSLEETVPQIPRRAGLGIDTARRVAIVDGALVELSRQNYQLLLYLYERAGRVCSREELVTQVFGHIFDPTDKSQEDRLNTAIHRLRERLEPGKGKPRFLVNTSDGYVLRLSSETI